VIKRRGSKGFGFKKKESFGGMLEGRRALWGEFRFSSRIGSWVGGTYRGKLKSVGRKAAAENSMRKGKRAKGRARAGA